MKASNVKTNKIFINFALLKTLKISPYDKQNDKLLHIMIIIIISIIFLLLFLQSARFIH
jgi:hypothetical protein